MKNKLKLINKIKLMTKIMPINKFNMFSTSFIHSVFYADYNCTLYIGNPYKLNI